MNIVIDIEQGPGNLPSTGYIANPMTWLGTDQEYQTAVDEYYRQIDGVGMGLEALSDLIKVRDILTASTETDKSTVKMAQIIIRKHQERLGVVSHTPGIESFSDCEVALEGIISFFKTIIMAIVNTLQAIISGIVNLFKSSRKDISSKNSEEAIDDAKDIRLDKTEPMPYKNGIFAPFFYKGTSITLEDIWEELQEYEVSVRHSTSLIEQIGKYQELLEKNINHLVSIKKTKDVSDLLNFIDKSRNGSSGFNSISEMVLKNVSRLDGEANYKDDIDSYLKTQQGMVSRHDFDVRAFNGYMDSKKVAVFVMMNDKLSDDRHSDIRVIRPNAVAKTPVTCDIAPVAHASLGTLAIVMEKINKSTENFDEVVSNLFEKGNLVDELTKLSNSVSNATQAEIKQSLFYVHEHVNWLSQITGMVRITDQSLIYYRQLFEFITKKYKEAEAKQS